MKGSCPLPKAQSADGDVEAGAGAGQEGQAAGHWGDPAERGVPGTDSTGSHSISALTHTPGLRAKSTARTQTLPPGPHICVLWSTR